MRKRPEIRIPRGIGRTTGPSKKTKNHHHGCPLMLTLDCSSWTPIPMTVQELGLTTEQVETYGITPARELLWCSECRQVWWTENNFAHIIGSMEIEGSDFIPGDRKRTQYLG